jgi:LysR family transcriptional regulator, glycine cleavage system transcriptional activator
MAARTPLNATLVFCAAARLGSFKLAAEELCVTPGAVSRQIRSLEDYIGQQLFERSFRDVRLTRAGEKLRARVADKMAAIQTELELLRSGGRRTTVRLDAGVTLAMYWLIPRLASFRAANPGIEVQLSTSHGPVDLGKRVDLHVRRNPAEFAGLRGQAFLEEYSLLVASPKLKSTSKTVPVPPKDLKRYERIAAVSRPQLWKQWSAHCGLEADDYEPTLEFDNTALAIQAAIEGLGALVVPEIFARNLLASGALIQLNPDRVRTGEYRILQRARQDSYGVRRFVEWLRQSPQAAF